MFLLEGDNILDDRFFLHNALCELVVISIDPRCLSLLRREVKTADGTDWTADRCDAFEMVGRVRSTMSRLFLLLRERRLFRRGCHYLRHGSLVDD